MSFFVGVAIRAKVNDKSDASLEEAEEMMRQLESPDAVVYQSCKYTYLYAMFYCLALH